MAQIRSRPGTGSAAGCAARHGDWESQNCGQFSSGSCGSAGLGRVDSCRGNGGRDPRTAGRGTTAKDSVAGATRPLALSKGSDGFESGPRCGPTVSLAWDGWQLEAGRGGGNRLGVRRVRRGTWVKGSKQRTGVSPQWGRSRSRGPAPADSDRHGPGGSAAARQSQWLEGIRQCQEEDGLMPRLRQAAIVVVHRAN